MMLLEKDPANRFPTAASLVAALETRVTPPSTQAPAAALAGTGHAPSAGGPYAPAPYIGGRPPLAGVARDVPTSADFVRWEAPPVVAFRKKLAPYLFVNGAIVLLSVVSGNGILFVTVIWSIVIASRYAKLWSEGFDWRDVFRQPRDREVMEVLEEGAEHVRALFDRGARERLRAERVQRRLLARSAPPRLAGGYGALPAPAYNALPWSPAPYGGPTYAPAPSPATAAPAGAHDDRIRQAMTDRDEIFRRLESLQGSLDKRQRDDVARSAVALAERVQSFAMQLDDLTRQDLTGARAHLEAEITTLENAANPLERGSEDRVRRLAFLKRQRRGLVDAGARRDAAAAKLETCALALQNMRFDLMRLGAGPQMHQQITSLANQAINLADNVDDALHVADEMGRLGAGRTSTGPPRNPGRG
jgi:hypothetical protein